MRKSIWLLLIAGLATAGCDRKSEVNEEVNDLKQAQQESPEVAQELRQELEERKAEVAKLQEKLTLAERGVTDRVVEERNELKEAVKRQEQNVNREVKEAQGAAQGLNTDAERARRELEATKGPGRVEAQVNTEQTVTPTENTVEVQKQQQNVPIETTKTVERRMEQGTKPAEGAPAAPAR